jgi:hypothetical protein
VCFGGRGREHTHLFIPSVACPSEDFIVDATVLCAFDAVFCGRRAADFVLVLVSADDTAVAEPVDGGTQLVLCGDEPFCEATHFFAPEAFACGGSVCLKEERGFHFDCRKEKTVYERRSTKVSKPNFDILVFLIMSRRVGAICDL